MKTISGNPQMLDESILSSVGKGRDNIIQDFLKSAFMSRQYKLLTDMSISLIDENVLLRFLYDSHNNFRYILFPNDEYY